MKTKFIVPCLLLMILTNGTLFAQSVKVDFDKKVIYCDSLNMPANTSARELLNLLPEVLQRQGIESFNTYDIKVEGLSLKEAKDVTLGQLHIGDIEKIEIDESPMSSYLQNGVGGSIDIVLRQHGSKTDKFWGSTGVSLSNPTDVAPYALLSHRSGKFLVRGVLLGEVYNNSCDEQTVEFDGAETPAGISRVDKDYKYRTQMARVYTQYQTGKDVLKLKLSETYQYINNDLTPNFKSAMTSSNRSKSTSLHVLLNWKHSITKRSSFVAEGQYIYSPIEVNKLYPTEQQLDKDNKGRNVSGKLEYKTALLPASSASKSNLTIGGNVGANFRNTELSSYFFQYDYLYQSEPRTITRFVQPYLRLDLTSGKFRAKVNADFQHFKYDITRLSEDYSVISNDFTGKFMTEYHFTPHKNLRLILDRRLNRPSDTQLFPMPYFNEESLQFNQGNPNLVPVLLHEIRLDYVTDYKWGEHKLMFDVSGSYNNIGNIIHTINTQYPITQDWKLDCVTYENDGRNHIYNANLMALYAYKAFTLSLTGNYYHNEQRIGDERNHYTYYNLALYGQFRLKDGWQGSAKLTYHSKVERVRQSLGDCALAEMSIGKHFDSFYLYVFDRTTMHKHAEDRTSLSNNAYKVRAYEMLPNVVGVGVKYSF